MISGFLDKRAMIGNTSVSAPTSKCTTETLVDSPRSTVNKVQAAEPTDAPGESRPMAVESSSSMNDQDFMAALSRAFKESEDRSKAVDGEAQEATEQAPEGERE